MPIRSLIAAMVKKSCRKKGKIRYTGLEPQKKLLANSETRYFAPVGCGMVLQGFTVRRIRTHIELYLSDEQLQISVANLFDAGTETTSTTLLWGFLYMMEYPEIQRKVQQEIDENIGTRIIRLEDKGTDGPLLVPLFNKLSSFSKVLLKYTDAVTLEIQRLASTVPLSVIHTTLAPIVVDGYEIPARTLLTLNSYAMHRNPRYWMHPDVVFPEHFLDKSGSIRIPKGYAPFGVGKLHGSMFGPSTSNHGVDCVYASARFLK